jgi:hypothetical protein
MKERNGGWNGGDLGGESVERMGKERIIYN